MSNDLSRYDGRKPEPPYSIECESCAELTAQRDYLLSELRILCNVRSANFTLDDEFRAWAQSRARDAIAKATGWAQS